MMKPVARSLLLVASVVVLTCTVRAAGPTGDEAFAIVSPDWVAARGGDPGVRILDVRTSVADYQHGHVPGAVFLANDGMRVPRGGLPVQYLDPEEMAAVFRRAGISAGDMVVVYADGADVLGATMVAYCLHRVGHRDVRIMDGGIEAYRTRHPLVQEYPGVGPGDLRPRPDPSLSVTIDDIQELMDRPGVVILDTRPPADYLGNTSRWMRNGHIPGAINLDWHRLMRGDNLHAFRPLEEMRSLVQASGARPEDDVIVYCGTSREATLVFQVLRHVLGYPKVRLYEGSWTEYCSVTHLPVSRSPVAGAPSSTAAAHRPAFTERLEPYECGTIKRLHTFGGIFLASQPAVEDFEQAAGSGVKTVVNMRHEKELTGFDEAALVSSLGLKYENPAWNGVDELTDEVLDRSRTLLRDAERPMLVHCSSANRVGAVWLAYRVLDGGLSWQSALDEARTVGLRSPAYEAKVKAYVERRQSQRK